MALVDGKYFLRASPASGTGGMFATSPNKEKAPVFTGAQVPGLIERQNWAVMTTSEEEHKYGIVTWTDGTVPGGYFTTKDVSDVPEGQIIINSESEEATEWIIEAVDTGIPGTYIVRPATKAVGMNWYVGTEGDNVVIKAFAVGDDSEKPYWQFVEAP